MGVISGVKQLRRRWYWLGAYRKSGLGGAFLNSWLVFFSGMCFLGQNDGAFEGFSVFE